ncbi:unnamed protein product [Oppiella nova]|uniref:PDZ domain-containing protein n=1 Tax=Oppiella nova TaxID=334625 RepID=A0A7R9LRF0_9ACAR|nr:unnamed protein product [Oppiella nova]CAG2166235.1 unnamed protein product [Oppiella nova]
MATMSTERPGFWRPPQGYRSRPRPQSCIWQPTAPSPTQVWAPSPTYSYDTNSLPRSPQVQSGSPASDAGLRPGDILLNVGNHSTTSPPMTHSQARDIINTTANTLNVQVQRPQQTGRSSATPLSPSRSLSPHYISEPSSSHTPYRPVPTQRGVIPNIHLDYDSSIRKPESNTQEYLKEKAREQWAINKQTYRTLPLIEPKPKVRRDWPTGSYMRHMEGPSWHDVPKTIINPNPPKLQEVMNRYGQGVQQNNPGVVHLQYNSPLNVYSNDNVANVLMPRPQTPRPVVSAPMVQPIAAHRSQHQIPLNVDITQSPTYQLLHEDDDTRPAGQSPKHSHSPIGLHSPAYPTQTPYFRSLMNSLLPNPGV